MTQPISLVEWRGHKYALLDEYMGRVILQRIGQLDLVSADPGEIEEIGYQCPACSGSGWVDISSEREFNVKGDRKRFLVIDAPGPNVVLRVNDTYHLVTATDPVKEAKGEVADMPEPVKPTA